MRMLARLKDEERFMKVWDAMKEADFPHDTVAYTQRINLYRLLNKPQEAIKVINLDLIIHIFTSAH